MTPTTHTNTGIRWDSPIPYLFGGLAMMLGLIAVALLILACTHDTRSRSQHDDNCPSVARISSQLVDDGPKFVVVMAGDHIPTFIAKQIPPLPLVESPPAGSVEHV